MLLSGSRVGYQPVLGFGHDQQPRYLFAKTERDISRGHVRYHTMGWPLPYDPWNWLLISYLRVLTIW